MRNVVEQPYICLVRIGGVSEHPRSPERIRYRPCGLPCGDTIPIEGVETPACVTHRMAAVGGSTLHRYTGPAER